MFPRGVFHRYRSVIGKSRQSKRVFGSRRRESFSYADAVNFDILYRISGIGADEAEFGSGIVVNRDGNVFVGEQISLILEMSAINRIAVTYGNVDVYDTELDVNSVFFRLNQIMRGLSHVIVGIIRFVEVISDVPFYSVYFEPDRSLETQFIIVVFVNGIFPENVHYLGKGIAFGVGFPVVYNKFDGTRPADIDVQSVADRRPDGYDIQYTVLYEIFVEEMFFFGVKFGFVVHRCSGKCVLPPHEYVIPSFGNFRRNTAVRTACKRVLIRYGRALQFHSVIVVVRVIKYHGIGYAFPFCDKGGRLFESDAAVHRFLFGVAHKIPTLEFHTHYVRRRRKSLSKVYPRFFVFVAVERFTVS